jgi:hypothetical protein
MRGSLVIVRDFSRNPLVRRVWSYDQDAVYISDELNYKNLLEGKEALMPVGFRHEDVFRYDHAVLASQAKPIDWDRLAVWKIR